MTFLIVTVAILAVFCVGIVLERLLAPPESIDPNGEHLPGCNRQCGPDGHYLIGER